MSESQYQTDLRVARRKIEHDLSEEEERRKKFEEERQTDPWLSKDRFEILTYLLSSRVFKINENFLSKTLRIHRKAVTKRVEQLIREHGYLNQLADFLTCFAPRTMCLPTHE
jgi:hypothetical protein